MQLVTLVSVAAATVASATNLRSAVTLNKGCDQSLPYARIVNRCDYTVNIWSVLKGDGCPTDQMVTLKKGETYSENYAYADKTDGRGVSIKISKTEECKGNDITQLEYFLDNTNKNPMYRMNYLDVSYVDCLDGDCPSKKEGFYLQAGSQTARTAKVTSDNSWCPVLACSDPISCAKVAYILPDDVQTRTCDLKSSMDLYLCGSHAPSSDDDKPSPAPPASSKQPEYSAPKPSSIVKPASSADSYKVNAAAITPVAEIKDAIKPKVKTEVVYVTKYEYINAKRSEHAHARRHQPFRA